jgi:hypothetical protein
MVQACNAAINRQKYYPKSIRNAFIFFARRKIVKNNKKQSYIAKRLTTTRILFSAL